MTIRLISLALAAAVLAGCAPFAPEPAPDVPTEGVAPRNFRPGQGPALAWWKEFGSAELDALEEKALAHSFDVLAAQATLRAARAAARQARSDLFPTLTADAGRRHVRTRSRNGEHATASRGVELGAGASYEVDLWGRLRSADKAARLRARASAEDLASARMTVAASVADAWARILSTREQIAVARQQIRTNEDLYRLRRAQYENGQAAALDLIQQKEALAQSQTLLPELEIALAEAENALAVLAGDIPGAPQAARVQGEAMPVPGPIPASGLPAEFLSRRPDVRGAWLALEAAGWDVSAAQANRFPALRLSADLVFSALHPSDIFRAWTRTLSAALSGTALDGGRLAAAVESAQAARDQALHAYTKAVARAIEEADNAIVAENAHRALLAAYEEQLALARIGLRQAERGWLHGVDTFSRYLTQLQDVQSLERSVASERGNILRARVTLCRTLGAGTAAEQQEAAQ